MMKKLIAIVLLVSIGLLSVPHESKAAASLVQKRAVYSASIAYSGAVVAGNLLVAAVSCSSAIDEITVVDNQSNSWTKGVSLASNVGMSATNAAIFYAVANGNNTPTLTVDCLIGSDEGGTIYEYSGVTSTTDGTSSVQTSSTRNPTATAFTTTATDTLVASFSQEQAGGTCSASSGAFTYQAGNGSHVDCTADYQNATAGSLSGDINFSANAPWLALQIAFKNTGAAVTSTQSTVGLVRVWVIR